MVGSGGHATDGAACRQSITRLSARGLPGGLSVPGEQLHRVVSPGGEAEGLEGTYTARREGRMRGRQLPGPLLTRGSVLRSVPHVCF